MLGISVEHKEEILFPDYVKIGKIIASHVEENKNESMLGILGHFYSKTFFFTKTKTNSALLRNWGKDKGEKKDMSNTNPT